MKNTLVPRHLLEHAARRFRLLSEPSRLQILNLLHVHVEMSVHDIVDQSGLGQANVSKHLGAMAREGLVYRRQEGLFAYYSIADASLSALCLLVCGQLRAEAEAEAVTGPDAGLDSARVERTARAEAPAQG